MANEDGRRCLCPLLRGRSRPHRHETEPASTLGSEWQAYTGRRAPYSRYRRRVRFRPIVLSAAVVVALAGTVSALADSYGPSFPPADQAPPPGARPKARAVGPRGPAGP